MVKNIVANPPITDNKAIGFNTLCFFQSNIHKNGNNHPNIEHKSSMNKIDKFADLNSDM